MWEGLLSQATLVGGAGADKMSSFSSRKGPRGLMSAASEVPWDIQLKGPGKLKAGICSLLKRLYDQGPSTMAGRWIPAHPPPSSAAASMVQHAQDTGLHYSTAVIRRVDHSDVQNHGKWRFTGMNLLLKAVLNSSDPGQYIRQGASKRTR